jgi:hypothetical protein
MTNMETNEGRCCPPFMNNFADLLIFVENRVGILLSTEIHFFLDKH